MRRLIIVLTPFLAAAAIPASVPAATVKRSHGHLVTSSGFSLYLWEKDTGKTSQCNGSCAQVWKPLTVKAKPTAGSGVKASKLSTHKRSDGAKQVLYSGHPLYV